MKQIITKDDLIEMFSQALAVENITVRVNGEITDFEELIVEGKMAMFETGGKP